ncbi:uncharacterized protein BYT42DRAFT_616930 [Radiomyces spectabilis]|uniref:uncharacterized protein n=1 Tax=Radiomyces spectabilis TaxID=64574 RepID=UPI00221E389E|nr:uncharacterized protein BYT42DRAFT_616930 [Radiomyces spectabilis]KAI8370377.1 hypothetical protein BYT42DRAFT_616930 [Radiomyces spectabilis]
MSDSPTQVVTAIDIVNQQDQLEREAQEALPGKFEQCTFSQGYLRQPLYACKTCSGDSEHAGMCYSCSMMCHADHDLIELFPKRHFRCDCGVAGKFGGHGCTLASDVKLNASNTENKYNHNFAGRYCRCDQVYNPDQEQGTMYQCSVCEDWFHDRCIGDIPESLADFESYICRQCTNAYPVLINGHHTSVTFGLAKGDNLIHRWATELQEDKQTLGMKRKNEQDTEPELDSKRSKTETDNTTPAETAQHVELLLKDGWRKGLCHCTECEKAWKDNHLEFLLEEEETYEPEDDEDAGKSLLEVGMEQLQRMDRVKALESVMAYQMFAQGFKEFLKGFQESGKVVQEEDIKRFFSEKQREREERKRERSL